MGGKEGEREGEREGVKEVWNEEGGREQYENRVSTGKEGDTHHNVTNTLRCPHQMPWQ